MRLFVATTLLLTLAPLAAHAEQELAVYPNTVHTRMGNDLVIGGEYFRMAYFTTDDPMPVVAAYFRDLWKKQGYPVQTYGDFREEGVVSAFYTREGLQRSIVLRIHQGKTVGFTSLRDLWTRPPVTAPGAVQLEGTLIASELGERDERGGKTRSILVERGIEEVMLETKQAMVASGYTPIAETNGDRGKNKTRVLEHRRGGERVITTVMALEADLTVVQQALMGEVAKNPASDAQQAPADSAAKAQAKKGPSK